MRTCRSWKASRGHETIVTVATFRHQAMIDAPAQVVWELVSDPNRHASWFPKVVSAQCDDIEQGCTYRQVVKQPIGGRLETTVKIEALDDCHECLIRCMDTNTSS